MLRTVRLANLRDLPPDERKAALQRVAEGGTERLNGELDDFQRKLDGFEATYGFPTSDLHAKLRSGAVRETREISEWLFYAELVHDLGLRA